MGPCTIDHSSHPEFLPYRNGAIHTVHPHLPPTPPPVPSDDKTARLNSEDRTAFRTLLDKDPHSWQSFFPASAFSDPWPSRPSPSQPQQTIRILGPLHRVGHRFAQILKVECEAGDPPLVAKMFDPYLAPPDDIYGINPIALCRQLFACEAHAYSVLHGTPTPAFHGAFTATVGKRTVGVLLMELVEGRTLVDASVPRTPQVLARAVEADMRLLEVGVWSEDVACRNFILREGREREVVMIDFEKCRFRKQEEEEGKERWDWRTRWEEAAYAGGFLQNGWLEVDDAGNVRFEQLEECLRGGREE